MDSYKEGELVYLNTNEVTNRPVLIGVPQVYPDGETLYPVFDPESREKITVPASRFNEQYLDEPNPEFDSLKRRALQKKLTANYVFDYRIPKVSGAFLSKEPADQYIFVNPMQDAVTPFVSDLTNLLGLDQVNNGALEKLKSRLSKDKINKLHSQEFKDRLFELMGHAIYGHALNHTWSVDELSNLKGRELQILAKLLKVPHTGSKKMVCSRLEKIIKVLKDLQPYSHQKTNPFGGCNMYEYDPGVQQLVDKKSGIELKFLCASAGLLTYTDSYGKALFLLNLKDQITRNIRRTYKEYRSFIPKSIRAVLEGNSGDLQKMMVFTHPELPIYQTVLQEQKHRATLIAKLAAKREMVQNPEGKPDEASKKLSKEEKNALDLMRIRTRMPVFDQKTANYMDSLGKKDIKVIISLSGGKDSIATYLLARAEGIPIHSVVFADTGWEFPEVYQMLRQIEEQDDIKIIRLLPRASYDDLLTKYSWPHMKGRWCTAEKVTRIAQYLNQVKEKESVMIECIGYAADEAKRALKMQESDAKEWPVYPLIDENMVEKDALSYAYSHGFFWGDSAPEGLYASFDRVSCFCCPLQNQKELEILRTEYPEYWNRMLDMEKQIIGRPDQIIGFQGEKKLSDIDQEMASAENEELNSIFMRM